MFWHRDEWCYSYADTLKLRAFGGSFPKFKPRSRTIFWFSFFLGSDLGFSYIVKITLLRILHDYVKVGLVGEGLVILYDVGMVDFTQNWHLAWCLFCAVFLKLDRFYFNRIYMYFLHSVHASSFCADHSIANSWGSSPNLCLDSILFKKLFTYLCFLHYCLLYVLFVLE